MNKSSTIRKVADYLRDFLDDPRAFRGQQLRGGGPVAEFESLFAQRCGFPWCVATCNATTALMGLAVALNLRGRTVWFPKCHWEGSVAAMRLMGAKVRRYNPDGCRVPVHRADKQAQIVITSASVDIAAIRQRFGSAGCLVVEDSSRLPGISVEMDDRSSADIQVMSFGPGKPLCLGEGGAVLFRSQAIHDRFIAFTMHPERTSVGTGNAPRVPAECLNARIHPVAAMLGIEALVAAGQRSRMLRAVV